MAEERKTDSPFGLRTALDGKTRLESQARVGKWRDGVAMLSHHITAQMEQCKELRNHETLKQIASEDPDQRDRKVCCVGEPSSLTPHWQLTLGAALSASESSSTA